MQYTGIAFSLSVLGELEREPIIYKTLHNDGKYEAKMHCERGNECRLYPADMVFVPDGVYVGKCDWSGSAFDICHAVLIERLTFFWDGFPKDVSFFVQARKTGIYLEERNFCRFLAVPVICCFLN